MHSTKMTWTEVGNFHAGHTLGSQAPHKRSYRPDLPSRSSDAAVKAWVRAENKKEEAREAKRTNAFVPPKGLVSKTAPHPDSFRPDIPLGGFKMAQIVKPTKEDVVYYQERPLTLTVPAAPSTRWESMRYLLWGEEKPVADDDCFSGSVRTFGHTVRTLDPAQLRLFNIVQAGVTDNA